MMRAYRIVCCLILSLFLYSCASTPEDESTADTNGAAPAAGSDAENGKQKHRDFDPCLINPNLAVCKQ